jgi:hypothetical protein
MWQCQPAAVEGAKSGVECRHAQKTHSAVRPEIRVLLAGAKNPQEPPNNPPEWVLTPSPSFVDGVSGTYDLDAADCTDADGDTLTYTLNAGSTALPSGVTLGTNGVLTADGTQTEATTTGIIVDADDGKAAKVASPSFSIV